MSYIKLGTIILLILVLIVQLFPASIYQNLGPLYRIKRLQEKTILEMKSSPQAKVDYLIYLLEQRAREIEQMILSRNFEYTLQSSLRYSATAGQLTEMVSQNDLNDKKQIILQIFNTHKTRFKPLLDHFPMDNTERKYLEDDINYLTIYADQLTKP